MASFKEYLNQLCFDCISLCLKENAVPICLGAELSFSTVPKFLVTIMFLLQTTAQ